MRSNLPVLILGGMAVASMAHCKGNDKPVREQSATLRPTDAGTDGGLMPSSRPMPTLSCGSLVGSSTCDPVTGWPCDLETGETCDYSNARARFECFPGPNTLGFCGACDVANCGAGTTCNRLGWCERYCCADNDCGFGKCLLDIYDEPSVAAVGYCEEEGVLRCAGPAGDAGSSAP